jgi:hypothetical protein
MGCDISNAIEFLASHFGEISSSLMLIDISLTDVILSQDGLNTKNKTITCGFAMTKFEKKSDMFELLVAFRSSISQLLESGCLVS